MSADTDPSGSSSVTLRLRYGARGAAALEALSLARTAADGVLLTPAGAVAVLHYLDEAEGDLDDPDHGRRAVRIQGLPQDRARWVYSEDWTVGLLRRVIEVYGEPLLDYAVGIAEDDVDEGEKARCSVVDDRNAAETEAPLLSRPAVTAERDLRGRFNGARPGPGRPRKVPATEGGRQAYDRLREAVEDLQGAEPPVPLVDVQGALAVLLGQVRRDRQREERGRRVASPEAAEAVGGGT